MDKVGKILKVVLNKKDLSKAAEAAQICYLANDWGKGRFEAVSFARSVLKLRVDNHCAAQEAQMLEEELLEYLEEMVGRKVKTIRWQIASGNLP